MQELNFPPHIAVKVTSHKGQACIWDVVRKKHLVLTPEEWVRQHLIHYLIADANYPLSRLAVEHALKVGNLAKRCDIVVFTAQSLEPLMLIECKAPEVTLNQAVFDQVARYNLHFKVPYLLVSNGLEHIACAVDHQAQRYIFFEGGIPNYEELGVFQ